MIDTRRISSRDFTEDKLIRDFILYAAADANQCTGNSFNWYNFPLDYFDHHYVNMAFRLGEPAGLMMASLTRSVFDSDKILLRQDLLWVPKGGGFGVSRRLLQDFIDFGRLNADHILTTRSRATNIKGRSLERLGFCELETFYRMEVKREHDQ